MIKIKKENNVIQNVSLISLLVNFALLIMKSIIGIISKSQAMLADSLNSAGDIFASFMSFIGSKIATKPRDKDHPYGHGKAEYIFSLIIGVIMIIASIGMVKNSFESIILNKKVYNLKLLIIACTMTIISKFTLYIYCRIKYKKKNSILIKTLMEDHRNDMFVTMGTVIGVLFSNVGFNFMDGVIGIIISLWILIVGIKIFYLSYKVLMDTNITEEMKEEIRNEILLHDYILNIDSISSKPIGDKYLLILEVIMDGTKTLSESHELGDILKQDIAKKFNYVSDIIVHVSPK